MDAPRQAKQMERETCSLFEMQRKGKINHNSHIVCSIAEFRSECVKMRMLRLLLFFFLFFFCSIRVMYRDHIHLDALIFCWCANLMFSLLCAHSVRTYFIYHFRSFAFAVVRRLGHISNQINCRILFVQSLTAELIKFNFTCKVLANNIFDHFAHRRLQFIRIDCIHATRCWGERRKKKKRIEFENSVNWFDILRFHYCWIARRKQLIPLHFLREYVPWYTSLAPRKNRGI